MSQCRPQVFPAESVLVKSGGGGGGCRSVVSDCCDPWTAALWAPLSVGFSRQEHWSGLPFPSPGDLPNPGSKHRSPALQADSLPSEPPGKPLIMTEADVELETHCTLGGELGVARLRASPTQLRHPSCRIWSLWFQLLWASVSSSIKSGK